MPQMLEGTTLMRHERLSTFSADEFSEHLSNRWQLVTSVLETVKKAVSEEEIANWEYPEVEQAIGAFIATLFSTPIGNAGPSPVVARIAGYESSQR